MPPPAKRFRVALLLCLALLLFAGFMSLGTWQIRRMIWKHALIARVTERVHAPPVDAPGRAAWPNVLASSDEYRHVRLHGKFLDGRATRVQAVTELGGGFWLLTPLQRDDGSIVLVNRGFVDAEAAAPPASDVPRPADVTGLLRITEPGGGFLRHNDAAADRWFSRDVAAIGARRDLPVLGPVAPYFVDADADAEAEADADTEAGIKGKPGASGQAAPARPDKAASNDTVPVGGLTVVAFSDNHLVYALTWYALGLMVAGVSAWLLRSRGWRDPVPADTMSP